MSDEESKAIAEVAKASRAIAELFERIFAYPVEQLTGALGDSLVQWRAKRALKLRQDYDQIVKSLGENFEFKSPPLKLGLPLIQQATLEDDNELHKLWVKLLVNVTNENGSEVRRSYITILENMTALDALNLERVNEALNQDGTNRIWTALLPSTPLLVPPEPEREPPERVAVSLANLIGLGLLDGSATYGGGMTTSVVTINALGRGFMRAVTLN